MMVINKRLTNNLTDGNSEMERLTLQEDVTLFCLKAASFPCGINDAHEKLHRILGAGRKHFGIAFPDDDGILYWAAAEITGNFHYEAEGCERFIVKKGNYIGITTRLMPDTADAGNAFQQLLNNPGVNPSSCFVTCYLPEGCNGNNAKDVRYMVRLAV